jgi:hypothetical protein
MGLMPAPQKPVHDVFVTQVSHAFHAKKAQQHYANIETHLQHT